jgi:3-hydroxybutyryl-CoA dehydratase
MKPIFSRQVMKNPDALPELLQVGYRFTRDHQFDLNQASAFAHAAGDENPVHHDQDHAAKTRFGKPIVSGTHSSALLMGLVASHLSAEMQVVGVKFTLEFVRPVFSDEHVVLEWEITAIQPHPRNGSYVELKGAMLGDDGITRLRAEGQVLVWSSREGMPATTRR